MIKYLNLLALVLVTSCAPSAFAATGSNYPSVNLQNQFGEKSINSIIGGSNDIRCSFKVDSTNVNGLGVSGLGGIGCSNVFMHTSATPATGNPNPAPGYIQIQLANNYFSFVGSKVNFAEAASTATVNITSGLTRSSVYIISSVGTSTAGNWQFVGLPLGLTPTAGQSFVALTSSAGTGTGTVALPVSSGVYSIDVVGSAGQMVGATGGAIVNLRIMGPASSSITTPIAVQPPDNTLINLHFQTLPLSNQLH